MTFLLFAMPAATGLMLATLFRSTALAVVAGLGWFLIAEEGLRLYGFATPVLVSLMRWLPRANADSLALSLGNWTATLHPDPQPVQASTQHFVLVLVVYVAVFVAAGAAVLQCRDVE